MTSPLAFRDPARADALYARLDRAMVRVGRRVRLLHVCGSHEQAIVRYGLRTRLPPTLDVRMGPGCPVCVTDAPDVDGAVALARSGVEVLTFGDMVRVPGSTASLADARAEGARVGVVTSPTEAVARAAASPHPVVFFATGFETTAVATAAILAKAPPENFSVLSAHKWVPAAMAVVAAAGPTFDGYLAAGHAAAVTGSDVLAPFVATTRRPVVVGGFEPLDLLAALCVLVDQVAEGRADLVNAYPRCVTPEGNRRAMALLDATFQREDGVWRGIAEVPGGELRLRPAFVRWDARVRFAGVLAGSVRAAETACVCGAIMLGATTPAECPEFGRACRPDHPLGACMVSTEGPCRNAWEAR